MQQKVFEQWFDLPLKGEKAEKGRRESEARNTREEIVIVQDSGGQEFKQWKWKILFLQVFYKRKLHILDKTWLCRLA